MFPRSDLAALTRPFNAAASAATNSAVEYLATTFTSSRHTAAGARAAVGFRTVLELLTWHLFLLAPTVAFKTAYLRTIWPGQELWAGGSLLWAEENLLSPLMAGVRLFGRDVLSVAAFVLGVWLLGTRGLRIGLPRLAVTTLLLASVLGGAIWLCLGESGGFLTPELASIAWHWVRDNPSVLFHFRPVRISVLIVAVVLWSLLLSWLLRRSAEGAHRPLLFTSALSVAAIVAAVLVETLPSTRSRDAGVARRGFWPAAVSTFWATTPPPAALDPPSAAQLAAAAHGLGYPAGRPTGASSVVDLGDALRVPRHVVLVMLETAPREYYPLTDNPEFPTFAAMSRQAIVSDHHYAPRPFSVDANYSALSGVYPANLDLGKDPAVATHGLASVLSAHGYATTYIDSYRFDWRGGDLQQRVWTRLGFSRLIQLDTRRKADRSFAARVAREDTALRIAVKQIQAAQQDRRKALVVIATTLGHYEWKSRPEHRHLPNARKLYELARATDSLMGRMLESLARHRISDVMIVVTGDHGLRYAAEFASLGEERRQAAARFNVPFLLYAPGLLSTQVRLPYATSHVDITPTVLRLLGVSTERPVHHGENMLDPALGGRALFLLNAGLAPFDYVVWRGGMYELDHLTGGVTVEAEDAPSVTLPAEQVRAMVDSALQVFDLTALRFARDRGGRIRPRLSVR